MRRIRLIAIAGMLALTAAFGADAAIAAPDAASGGVLGGSTLTAAPSVTATSNELFGVGCPAVKECVAVGQYSGGLLAETWNGKSWTPTTLPSIKGASGANLEGKPG